MRNPQDPQTFAECAESTESAKVSLRNLRNPQNPQTFAECAESAKSANVKKRSLRNVRNPQNPQTNTGFVEKE